MSSPIMKYFTWGHLPEYLQEVSALIAVLAETMDNDLPDGPEKSAGLRKLLEAKDCFVRAKLGYQSHQASHRGKEKLKVREEGDKPAEAEDE